MNTCNKFEAGNAAINLNVSDLLLTPLSCSSIISEIIKVLLYEKSQLPHSYNWLKSMVTKRRKAAKDDDHPNEKRNFTAARYFNIVSSAYDAVETMMESIKKALQNDANVINEVLIIFGTTPLNPKQSFSIKLSNILHDHVESNHVQSNLRKQQTVLRKLFLSEDWLKAVSFAVPLTNMYLMLKKTDKSDKVLILDNFSINRNYNVPARRCVQINFECEEDVQDLLCCKNLLVYGDNAKFKNETETDTELGALEDGLDGSEEVWLQCNTIFKGYKDCFINKVHASELW